MSMIAGLPAKEYHRRWREQNPEKALAAQRRYYDLHSDRRCASTARWKERNLEQVRLSHIPRRYGISVEEYKQMLLAQDGKCAICLKPETVVIRKTGKLRALSVDHDHKTGKVRALLCKNCNVLLGLIEDDPRLLVVCEAYLVKHLDSK